MTSNTINLIWQLNKEGKKSREHGWINHIFRNVPKTNFIDGKYDLVKDKSILIIGYGLEMERLKSYVNEFDTNNFRFGIYHIGDESLSDGFYQRKRENTDELLSVYKKANFVFRTYWRSDIGERCFVRYVPLGTNCNVHDASVPDFADRSYTWSFAGQIRDGSRKTMVEAANGLEGGRLAVSNRFNSGLRKEEYIDLLLDSKVVLCPRGWSSVETYRFYEALEAGAIPLVEDEGGSGLLRENCNLQSLAGVADGGWRSLSSFAKRLIVNGSYWESAYGSDFPCPRIYRWENLPHVLDNISIGETNRKVSNWWKSYKSNLFDDIFFTITNKLSCHRDVITNK